MVMKAMTMEELNQLVLKLNTLKGAELLRCHYDEKALQLLFQAQEGRHWLTMSLKPGVPFAFLTQERLPLVKKLKKPLSLFLDKHFSPAQLKSCEWLSTYGRALRLHFQLEGHPSASLYLSLVPGAVNIQAQVAQKSVWAFKPKDVEPGSWELDPQATLRDSDTFLKHWQKLKDKAQTKDSLGAQLKKKEKALTVVSERLEELRTQPWQLVGEFLKEKGTFDELPPDWEPFVDKSQELFWNIKNCFELAKKNQQKLEGARLRQTQLQQEITHLKSGASLPKKSSKQSDSKSLLHEAQAKGRTYQLSDQERLYIGRSAVENLKLLRRAKPWHLWLHIRDYPGAFGVWERPRGAREPSPEHLEKATHAVIAQSLPRGSQGTFDVLYTECRYVRPIKGAKAGQVTFTHERVITIKVSHD